MRPAPRAEPGSADPPMRVGSGAGAGAGKGGPKDDFEDFPGALEDEDDDLPF